MIFVGSTGPRPTTTCACSTRRAGCWRKRRVPDGVEGLGGCTSWWPSTPRSPARWSSGSRSIAGLLVGPLVAAGYQVLRASTRSPVSRYRDRHATSGAKSDPGDAKVLADLVRTDRHNHRPGGRRQRAGRGDQGPRPGPSEPHLDPPAPDQRSCARAAGVYPAALAGLRHRPRLGRRRWPCSRSRRRRSWAGALSRSKIAAALRRGGRQRNLEAAAEIQRPCGAHQLEAPRARCRAYGDRRRARSAVIGGSTRRSTALEAELADTF